MSGCRPLGHNCSLENALTQTTAGILEPFIKAIYHPHPASQRHPAHPMEYPGRSTRGPAPLPHAHARPPNPRACEPRTPLPPLSRPPTRAGNPTARGPGCLAKPARADSPSRVGAQGVRPVAEVAIVRAKWHGTSSIEQGAVRLRAEGGLLGGARRSSPMRGELPCPARSPDRTTHALRFSMTAPGVHTHIQIQIQIMRICAAQGEASASGPGETRGASAFFSCAF